MLPREVIGLGGAGELTRTAASPSRIKIVVRYLCDGITTITMTAGTSVSATARAIGNPFAASGAVRKIAQSSRTWR
jgi:hypothetical protein